MQFRKFKQLEVPRLFTFIDPYSSKKFKGTSIQDLVQQVSSYRQQNDKPPIEYLSSVIENFLCTLPIHAGACEPIRPLKRSIVQYVQGGIALLKNIAYSSFATQETANKRSEICSRCPHNVFYDRDKFIKWSDDIAERSVGKRRSSHHDSLGNCEICSCPLRAKVWWSGKIKVTEPQAEQMKALDNPKCWQVEFINGDSQ